MQPIYKDASIEEVDQVLKLSTQSFEVYKGINLRDRAKFLYAIAATIETVATQLVAKAQEETNLDEGRLQVELQRTLLQLRSYADACAEGSWLDIRIDTGNAERTPPKPDLRKTLVPLGPVVVFGASNFPFAYSTAGGDTACALAAGCTVIIKAHPAHAETSEMVATAIQRAAKEVGLPAGVCIHLHGAGFEVGQALVKHALTQAVAFTGSFEGGKALFKLANEREEPIPVFAEMGSVNPVFILPKKLQEDTATVSSMLAASITQSAGQFCTKPGIIIGIESEGWQQFKKELNKKIIKVAPVKMLHAGIVESFHKKRVAALQEAKLLSTTTSITDETLSCPTLAEVAASTFVANKNLHKEIFGPYCLLITCQTEIELLAVAAALEGQLTTTIWAMPKEAEANQKLVETLKEKCGRLIFNGVSTGVEVALSMHHGGPYPATTDSRFTAVGADGIKRFARPICYQGWPNELLPDELKNENPLQLWRTVNNIVTKSPVGFG